MTPKSSSVEVQTSNKILLYFLLNSSPTYNEKKQIKMPLQGSIFQSLNGSRTPGDKTLRVCCMERLAEISGDCSELTLLFRLFCPSLENCCWPLSWSGWWGFDLSQSHLYVRSKHPAPERSFKQIMVLGVTRNGQKEEGGGCKRRILEGALSGC